nr:DNA-3-methyladenine glycosylase I [uncultured Desulfobulbus sp.]
MLKRCGWCGDDALYVAYHDNEWGVPLHDEQMLFEFLILEGAQAGLSWLTILKKRENYRKAFNHFNCELIARYSPDTIEQLLANSGIVRNRLKIEATVKNARATLGIREQYGSLATFLWKYVDGVPRQNSWASLAEIPAQTKESNWMSKDLKKHGFTFVGPTICYAFMQATGMVNDHLTDCFRHEEIRQLKSE